MISTIIRTSILYLVVIIGIRLMGKRQIGDMQPNELVITLLISEIAAIPLQDTDQPILNGIAAISVLVILEILLSVIAMKSFIMHRLMSGRSVVVIKDGVIDQRAMKRVRLTVVDLVELLRGQNVFDISTVAFAVLEVNGQLSVLLKSGAQPVTVDDMKLKPKLQGLAVTVISDGKTVPESLSALDTDETAITKLLKGKRLEIADVFLMTLDHYGNSCIIEKDGIGGKT